MSPSRCIVPSGRNRRRRAGFSLMEVLLALALLALLAGGIFAVQRGAISVSAEVAAAQTQTLRMHSFCELLRRTFEQAPGNARVYLTLTGGQYSGLSDVAFVDYPLAFTWPGIPAGSKTVIFRTQRAASGLGAEARLLYLDEEETQLYEQGRSEGSRAIADVLLMESIRNLTWRFYDDRKQEWELEWPRTNNRRPTFVELRLEFLDGQDPVRLVFWIPQMANPEEFTRNQGGPGGGGGGGGGGGDGDGAGGPGRDRPRGGAGAGGGRGAGGGGRGPGGGGRGPGGGGGGRGPGGGGGGPPRGR